MIKKLFGSNKLTNYVIAGCGDIGRRIASILLKQGVQANRITGLVRQNAEQAGLLGIAVQKMDLDTEPAPALPAKVDVLFYTIAPQKSGISDLRSSAFLSLLNVNAIVPKRIVLISTTGVYGDQQGEWVDEATPCNPQTGRGQRRLDMERQWSEFCLEHGVILTILRVPGIYAYSRLPKQRLQKRTPVVAAEECGFSNRIHADDLAGICVHAVHHATHSDIYNATDGTPGKITLYLQAAAKVLNFPALPEISMAEAQTTLSEGMLSYLSESRKISNEKLRKELGYELRYPDYLEGMRHG